MSADIVRFPQFGPSRAHPILVQVQAYWDSLRDGRNVPTRAEVHPKGLSGALSDCFVLERIAPGLARIRVAGRNVAAVMGDEPRGLPFGLFFERGTREEVEPLLERVFTGPVALDLAVMGKGSGLTGAISGEMLLLPLKDDSGRITRALGCVKMAGSAARHGASLTLKAHRARMIPRAHGVEMAPLVGPEPDFEAQILTFPGREG